MGKVKKKKKLERHQCPTLTHRQKTGVPRSRQEGFDQVGIIFSLLQF